MVQLQLKTAKYPSDRQFYLWHLVYLDLLFLLGDWQFCKSKCFVAFTVWTKSLTLICIYGDCNIHTYIRELYLNSNLRVA